MKKSLPMMMKKRALKRSLCLMMTVLFLMLTFFGCGKEPDSTTKPGASSESSANSDSDATKETDPKEGSEGTSASEDPDTQTEAPTEDPEAIDYEALFGEESEAFPGTYRLKGFYEGLPENEGITCTAVLDDRASVSFVKDGSLWIYEYVYADASGTLTDLKIPAAHRTSEDPDTGEEIDLGLEWKTAVPCQGVYACFADNRLVFTDRQGRAGFSTEMKGCMCLITSTYAAESLGNTLYIYTPEGKTVEWPLSYTTLGVLEGDAERVLIYAFDDYHNAVFLEVDVRTGEAKATGILDDLDAISLDLYSRNLQDGTKTVLFYREGDEALLYPMSETEYPLHPMMNGFLATAYSEEAGEESDEITYQASFSYYDRELTDSAWSLGFSGTESLDLDHVVILDDYLIFCPNESSDAPEILIAKVEPELDEASERPAKYSYDPSYSGISLCGDYELYGEKNYPKATEIYTDNCSFGIGLYYGEDVLGNDFVEYDVAACQDFEKLNNARAMVLNFLNSLPEGLLDEVILPYRGLDIYLTDDIWPVGSEGIESVSAFTTDVHLRKTIVYDINKESFYRGIHHEFLHVFEDRMLKTAGTEEEVFKGWDALNPEGFSYYDAYHLDDGSEVATFPDNRWTSYDPAAASSPEEIWFFDAYAKTYASEDRARTFEFASCGAWKNHAAYKSSHILKKLEYISEVLREYYDSLKNAKNLPWEEPLHITGS